MEKTKIIATYGPSCEEPGILKEMVINGLDVLRINMSYTSREECLEIIEELDKIMKAQSARGADFESKKLSVRMKSLIPILVPLFVGCLIYPDSDQSVKPAVLTTCFLLNSANHGTNGIPADSQILGDGFP